MNLKNRPDTRRGFGAVSKTCPSVGGTFSYRDEFGIKKWSYQYNIIGPF